MFLFVFYAFQCRFHSKDQFNVYACTDVSVCIFVIFSSIFMCTCAISIWSYRAIPCRAIGIDVFDKINIHTHVDFVNIHSSPTQREMKVNHTKTFAATITITAEVSVRVASANEMKEPSNVHHNLRDYYYATDVLERKIDAEKEE